MNATEGQFLYIPQQDKYYRKKKKLVEEIISIIDRDRLVLLQDYSQIIIKDFDSMPNKPLVTRLSLPGLLNLLGLGGGGS